MNPRCLQHLNSLRARPLTAAQAKKIDENIRSMARELWDLDPQFATLTTEQRTLRAAERAMQKMQHEAQMKTVRAQMQIVATAKVEAELRRIRGPHRAAQIVHHMERVDTHADAIRNEYMGQMIQSLEAAHSTEGVGVGRAILMRALQADNPQMTRDIVTEIYANANGGTGNRVATDVARAWLDTVAEKMRQRFNNAGGDVGKLWYGYLPHLHSTAKMLAAGADAWATRTLQRIDRSKYRADDGRLLNDAETLDVLRGMWKSLVIGDHTPGSVTAAPSRIARGSQKRQLHFKDGDAYIGYMAEFGDGTLYDAMSGHIGGMARNIALVEAYGPNPNAQMRLQFDLAAQQLTVKPEALPRVFGMRPQSYWDALSGTAGAPASVAWSQGGQLIRNVNTASMLGSAVLSAVGDVGTLILSTGYHMGIRGYIDLAMNLAKQIGPGGKEMRDFANLHGLLAESAASHFNRWAGENVVGGWSGRVANSVMRISGMNAWTDWLRRGFGLTLMAATTRMSRTAWNALDAADRAKMERAGITQADWNTLRQAQPDTLHDVDLLTPEALRAAGASDQLVTKYLAFLIDESEYAVVNPDLASRTVTSLGGTQAGTARGEVARAVMQFKAFPIAMVSRHLRRAFEQPGPMNTLLYVGALMSLSTLFGAVSVQMKQIAAGKDPIDMSQGKFWPLAIAAGGGTGFIGDLLLRNHAEDFIKTQWLFELLGPSAGRLAQLGALVKGNIDSTLAGEETHAAGEALRLGKSLLPFQNLWITRAAIDNAMIANMQDALSPGYIARMKRRARKNFGQDYWWRPGELTPERAPDVAAAVEG